MPDVDEPIAALISRRVDRYKKQTARAKAERWLPLHVPENQPFGVLIIGDPHLDDNGCNWPTLLRDVAIAGQPGVYGVCVGDKRNNWVGRLVREYMDQETTASDGRRLAAWFLRDAGINWAFSVLGNHDLWNEGEAIASLIADRDLYIASWAARVELRAGAHKWRVHCAHDFPGSSIYNLTHGPARAAMFSGAAAEVYVCGHRHVPALQTFPIDETGRFVHAIRARGYKRHDSYARQQGYSEGDGGESIFLLFNPGARGPAGRIQPFTDPELGADVLKALRKRG